MLKFQVLMRNKVQRVRALTERARSTFPPVEELPCSYYNISIFYQNNLRVLCAKEKKTLLRKVIFQ